MKFGAMNFPIKPVMEEVKKIAGLGFDYVELSLDPPCAHYTDVDRIHAELDLTLTECGMDLVCHLPTFVYTADLSPEIRKASLEEMIASLRTASRLRAAKAVLHPSMFSGLGHLVPDLAAGLAHQSLSALANEAETLRIPLCFENMFPTYHCFFEPDHFIPLFKAFPRLQLTLDIGHASIGDVQGKRLSTFIRKFPDRIGHIHLSDNNGKTDDHFPVGKGGIDFYRFAGEIKKTGYDDTMTLEVFSPDPEDLVESRRKMAALFS